MNLRLFYLLIIVSSLFAACTDECENVECNNGTCNETSGECDCFTGWTGADCLTEVVPCTDDCGPYGTCDELSGVCACEDGFTGASCLEIVSGEMTGDISLAANNIYSINGKLVVSNGTTLTIGCGSILKFAGGQGANSSALVVARGGKLICDCTENDPVIFTTDQDNIQIGELTGSNLDENSTNLWGGLIVLGRAPISAGDGDTEASIEGLPAAEWSKYGGSDVTDNSGILRYISVRHGGIEIGAGNEINGITFGGVGNGTVVENIEVVANLDDGVEFFGGSVNATNVIVGYQGDDGVDVDQNYSGTVSNFLVQHAGSKDGLEIDGPEGTATDGFFTLQDGTLRSESASNRAGTFKSKAQGTVKNIKVENYDALRNFRVRASYDGDNNCAQNSDAYLNLINGSLTFDMLMIPTATFVSDYVSVLPDDDDVDANTGQACHSVAPVAEEQACDDIINAGNNGAGTATGCNESVFQNWTWMANNGKL